MALDQTWFSEPNETDGTAFSLKLGSKLHEEKSAFQTIEVYETKTFGRLMVIDGYVMLTDRDNFLYHEMMTHPALYAHPNPKRVLVIGGGDCGSLKEVLRHPEVEEATQVEIDERVTRLSEQYFPALCASNGDPRARLVFDDGLAWVKNAAPGSLDVIIVDSTDPIGPAQGLFNEPFYRDVHRALGENGILVQQTESPILHLDKILLPCHDYMRSAGFADTVSLHFPQCVYPGGWWTATMAGKGDYIRRFREEDAQARSFPTRYYNEGIHRAALAQPQFMIDRGYR
ncbi:MAG: polyamine aminopropyltransferase [Chromatiales bacterium]|nr:polyamine aminopropyltransferase [Chromatiales bacterium]